MENNGLRAFAQLMIEIGSKHGNINIDDILYGRDAVRDSVFTKMKECQSIIKRKLLPVPSSVRSHPVQIWQLTISTKILYSNFTVFWINEDWKLRLAMYKCEQFPEKKIGQNIL